MEVKNRKFWREFIDLYASMPCLWKIKSTSYCDRKLKNQCYAKMVEKLKEFDPDANREKVVRKINVFRTNYNRDLKKIKISEKYSVEPDEIFQSRLWYFEKFKFLEEQECSSEEKCSMDPKGFNTESGDETFEKPLPKKRKVTTKMHNSTMVTTEENLLKTACPKLTNSGNASSVLAQAWATQYEELSREQKLFTRTIFADILFHGCLNKLTDKTVEDIHKVLKEVSAQPRTPNFSRTSTPYIDDYTARSSQSYSSSLAQHFEDPLFSPSHEQSEIVVRNKRPITINHQVLPTEKIQPIH